MIEYPISGNVVVGDGKRRKECETRESNQWVSEKREKEERIGMICWRTERKNNKIIKHSDDTFMCRWKNWRENKI